jgi:DNA repair photolyase
MKPPIYEPAGKAKEYGDYAINIYTGCPHGCFYCFAPNVLHGTRESFKSIVEPRKGIIEEVKKQLATGDIRGKLIHLCFTCDPYPYGHDTTPTRDIIKAIKDSGNHVQILTKGDGSRDFDLLDENDWYGATYVGYGLGEIFDPVCVEPNAACPAVRLAMLSKAHKLGIKTWMSMEPVLNENDITTFLDLNVNYVDRYKIGKLNYHPSDINWGEFGKKCERICKNLGHDYYIKESLRKEMEVQK